MIFPCENQKIKASVQSFIASHRIPHAILIEGESKSTNIELAHYIATAAVCSSNSAPCDSCKDCHLAAVGSHPDITTVKTVDGKKFLSVDQVRELRADAFIKAHSATHRVFIIEDADCMNPQAQNALLKVLEEPPQNVIFILLVASKTVLLDTIISRCVLLSLTDSVNTDLPHAEIAEQFISLLLSGSEYEMLKLLLPLEKSRTDAEAFFSTLAVCTANRLKRASSHARVLDRLFDDTKYYLELLSTNINMSLLISLAASRSKSLLDI